MSRLILVRHAQASFMAADYDQLSPLGMQQARVLGDHWASSSLVFDRVYAGTLRRHQQTMAAVAEVYRAGGLPWPEPIILPNLDEHDRAELVDRALPVLAEKDEALQALYRMIQEKGVDRKRLFMKAFQQISRLWVQGVLDVGDAKLEPWSGFRDRVAAGLAQIVASSSEGGETVAVFTSGGPVAAAMGWVLGLDDEQTLELSWIVQNAACTEFLFSEGRLSLKSFNTASYISEEALVTYI